MLNNPSNSDFTLSKAVLKKVNSMLTTGVLEYLDSQTFVDVMDFFNNQLKYQDAIRIGDFGLKIHFNSGAIHLKKAQAYSNLNQLSKAKEHLSIAENQDRKNGDIFLTKGMLYSKEGFSTDAIKAYRESINYLEFPTDAFPYLAFELKAVGQFQEAISILKKYLLEYPEDEMCSSMLFGIFEEYEYYRLGIKTYKNLVDIAPFSHLNWFYLGLFYKVTDENKLAYQAFEYAYLLDSTFVASYHEMANILIENKVFYKAISILEEVVEIEEPYAMTFTKLAELYKFSNNFSKALKYAKRAVKEDPQLDSAWFELGHILLKLEDITGAQTAFRNAKGLNDDEFDYHLNYANTYMRLEDWSVAKDLMISIINRFGMHDGLLKNVLICSVNTNAFEEALTYATNAIEYSKDVDFLYFAAYFNYKLNNKDNTLTYLIKAINENPNRIKSLEILMKDMFEESYVKLLVIN